MKENYKKRRQNQKESHREMLKRLGMTDYEYHLYLFQKKGITSEKEAKEIQARERGYKSLSERRRKNKIRACECFERLVILPTQTDIDCVYKYLGCKNLIRDGTKYK